MRFSILAGLSAVVAVTACVENTAAPVAPPTFHISATVTGSNDCDVTAMDKTYSSKGQIRGDVPSKFIGTVPEQSYHGFGCWVATSDGDGDLIVLFSGNNLGKPLAVGTYPLVHEVLDNTPLGKAAVTFRPSALGGDKLRTLDDAVGNVVVDSTATGARIIRVEAELVRWRNSLL